MFARPTYLEASAWLEHIPFAFWMIEAHQPRVMVELGTHRGTSYFAFCQAVERLGLDTRCFAVDTWKGDEHSGFYGEEVFEQVRAHNDAQYSGFSRLIRSSFDAACGHFNNRTIDLLHIDGYHTLDAVTHDFEKWRPKLSERAVVLMHDTNVRERNFGVFEVFEHLQETYPAFEFVHGHGLGVLGVGPEQNELLKQLFEAREDEQASRVIHEVFGRLGRACADALASKDNQARLRDLENTEKKRKTELEDLKGALQRTEEAERSLMEVRHRLAETESALAQRSHEAEGAAGELAATREELMEARHRLAETESALAQRSHETEETAGELAATREELTKVRHRLAETESALAQRSHEAEETAGELAATREELRQMASARAEAETGTARLTEHIVLLMADVQERQAAFATMQQAHTTELAETDKAIAVVAKQVNQVLAVLETSRHELATRLTESEQARARQSTELQQQADKIAALKRQVDEKQGEARRAVGGLLNGHSSLLPWRPFRLRRQAALLRRSGLFDAEWYLREYTDLAQSGMDPLRHYIEFGAREGRAPNPALAHSNGKAQPKVGNDTVSELDPSRGPESEERAVADAHRSNK